MIGAGNIGINLLQPEILVGLVIGAMLPFIFSALTMQAVGRAAQGIVDEVRAAVPGDSRPDGGTASPDSARCVDISTRSALREMIIPGLMAVIAPIATGFILGPAALGGLLIGAVASGFMLAITDGLCRRFLGQRQEIRGAGQPRRQGFGCSQGGGRRRCGWRPVQGHIRPSLNIC